MQRYQNFGQFVDAGHGRRYAAAQVAVFLAGTTTLASIYSDNASPAAPKANPFTIDRSGYFFFYALGGRYDIAFTSAFPQVELPTTWPDIVLYDPLDTLTVHQVAHGAATVNAGEKVSLAGGLSGVIATDSVWLGEYDNFGAGGVPAGVLLEGVEITGANLIGFVYQNVTAGNIDVPALTWTIMRFRP